ncbi:cytochrome C oxidase subunit IV family protein [Consotaella salsifontis]|uniref:Caa(3)-type oxidase, subunit IV n=1 Tax=Consotaella salsifontis TaxID=1365950 RepID=A0A1T4PP40_9HYPH|nr:cytochrome C oxidase subunit IV family protein [Consotaella salsifontis]SJZ93101.1 caa(3)-type oxidase, subunit IV [Consotaella salsifontis]
MTAQTRSRTDRAELWRLSRGSLVIGVALMALLALTLVFAYVPMGAWNAPVSYAIAAAKALLVAAFFMKLKSSPALLTLAALAGLFWLATLFALSLTDYPFRQAGERITAPVPSRIGTESPL